MKNWDNLTHQGNTNQKYTEIYLMPIKMAIKKTSNDQLPARIQGKGAFYPAGGKCKEYGRALNT